MVYVQIESPSPVSIKAQSLTAALRDFEFEVPEVEERPEFDPSISDPKALVNHTRVLPLAAGSGNLGNSIHSYTNDALSQRSSTDCEG